MRKYCIHPGINGWRVFSILQDNENTMAELTKTPFASLAEAEEALRRLINAESHYYDDKGEEV